MVALPQDHASRSSRAPTAAPRAHPPRCPRQPKVILLGSAHASGTRDSTLRRAKRHRAAARQPWQSTPTAPSHTAAANHAQRAARGARLSSRLPHGGDSAKARIAFRPRGACSFRAGAAEPHIVRAARRLEAPAASVALPSTRRDPLPAAAGTACAPFRQSCQSRAWRLVSQQRSRRRRRASHTRRAVVRRAQAAVRARWRN